MSHSLNVLNTQYFEWLCDLVCDTHFSKYISYEKLLTSLHNTNFTYLIPKDQNRAEDGIGLRYRFATSSFYESSIDTVMDALDGPCSVLEMMIALAIRCEENIMDDPNIGDRTRQWFWGMVTNLGLSSMTNNNFDERIVEDILRRFLNREYDPDGKGGLFTIRRCDRDLRNVEIWYQLCWYLDSIT